MRLQLRFWFLLANPRHPWLQRQQKKKESDDASDESTPTRSKSQPVVRRNKEYRYPTHRWSQFKISFDNDSVRLESEMHPLQSTGGAGGSAGGERAAGSLSTGPSGALMTTSSSISAAGGTIAPSAASTVPPTIKIIGKEVSRTIKIDGPCNASNKLARSRTRRKLLAIISVSSFFIHWQEKKGSAFFFLVAIFLCTSSSSWLFLNGFEDSWSY